MHIKQIAPLIFLPYSALLIIDLFQISLCDHGMKTRNTLAGWNGSCNFPSCWILHTWYGYGFPKNIALLSFRSCSRGHLVNGCHQKPSSYRKSVVQPILATTPKLEKQKSGWRKKKVNLCFICLCRNWESHSADHTNPWLPPHLLWKIPLHFLSHTCCTELQPTKTCIKTNVIM